VNILALDTTSEFASVAVRSEGRTTAELMLRSPDGFAHVIFHAIGDVLAQAGIRLEKVDCFAAASGPGSFTGVRVGLSAVKGLAEALGKTVLGVSNLRALGSFGNLPLRAVFNDARRGEVYAAVYNSDLEPVAPEAVLKLSDWLAMLHEPQYEFISGSLAADALQGTRFAGMPFIEAPKSLAAAVAFCAERDRGLDPATLDANYVRRSDAELFWRDAGG
jgi:tRNA threonylcarbamoyladenosine biosynthesis protein TsaB